MAVTNGVISPDKTTVTEDVLKQCIGKKSLLYDKKGEEHYNLISALHKSMRNSDPDAAVYWLARMRDLPRIQCASSGTVYAMGTINLTDRKKMPDIALPPLVSSNSPVVMLGAHSYLQILPGQINVMAAVNFNGRRIHMFQPLIGCIQKSLEFSRYSLASPARYRNETFPPSIQRGRVMHEIQKDPSSL